MIATMNRGDNIADPGEAQRFETRTMFRQMVAAMAVTCLLLLGSMAGTTMQVTPTEVHSSHCYHDKSPRPSHTCDDGSPALLVGIMNSSMEAEAAGVYMMRKNEFPIDVVTMGELRAGDPVMTMDCFAADLPAWKVDGFSLQQVTMGELRAGDLVMAMDDTSGRRFADRVVRNVHAGQFSRTGTVLDLHHSGGSAVSVTPGHAVFVDGAYMAAKDAGVGGAMLAAPQDGAAPVEVLITRISEREAQLVNPITDSGRILAGEGSVLAGSVPYTPGNLAMRLASLPMGFWKLASWMAPAAYQDSALVEVAMTGMPAIAIARAGAYVPLPLALPFAAVAMLVYDTVVCVLFAVMCVLYAVVWVLFTVVCVLLALLFVLFVLLIVLVALLFVAWQWAVGVAWPLAMHWLSNTLPVV